MLRRPRPMARRRNLVLKIPSEYPARASIAPQRGERPGGEVACGSPTPCATRAPATANATIQARATLPHPRRFAAPAPARRCPAERRAPRASRVSGRASRRVPASRIRASRPGVISRWIASAPSAQSGYLTTRPRLSSSGMTETGRKPRPSTSAATACPASWYAVARSSASVGTLVSESTLARVWRGPARCARKA